MRIAGIIFAYIALILLIILCIKPIIRKINNEKLNKMQKFLTKNHILISILFLISLILHIVLSMDSTFSLYSAKISLLSLVLSIIFACLIKVKPKLFLKLHYIFAFICLLTAIIHIVEIKIF